ncbi:MAG: LLM class F420-dependent oxidoreductase [Candidatus Tectimicrobiota bacterium]
MQIGISLFPGPQPIDVAVVAQQAEALGFASFWMGEHPVMPVQSSAPAPGTSGGSIPEFYSRLVDPFIALARASAVTTTLKLGTGVTLVPERNPLLLAKEVATLDYFSKGRFLFGVGAGWHKEETEIMGGNFAHRWTQTREAIEAMQALWTNEAAEYHGTYYDFPLVRSFPRPVQQPHPPIFLGGTAQQVFKRIVAYGNGWMPTRSTPELIRQGREVLNELALQAGRDPRAITVMAYLAPTDRDVLETLASAGADAAVVRLDGESEAAARTQLEDIARKVL